MPNILNQNPIIIEVAQTSYKAAVAATLGTLFTLRVQSITWQNPAKAGDVLLICDPASGNTLYRAVAYLPYSGAPGAVPQEKLFVPARLWVDFEVPQIDSGILEIGTI